MPHLLLLLCLALPALTWAEPSQTSPEIEPLALIGEPLRGLALPGLEPVAEDLRRGRWTAAIRGLEGMERASFTEGQHADHAFLLAWCLVQVDRGDEAASLLDRVARADSAPPAYRAWVRGEVYRALEHADEALAALEEIPVNAAVYAGAARTRAEVLVALDRADEAHAVYQEMIDRPDPVSGNAGALIEIARHLGSGSAEAYPYLRRVWSWYPHTREALEATRMLGAYSGAAYRPTWQEVGIRAERLMVRGDYAGALSETARRLDEANDRSVDACRYRFVRGRSNYKLNRLGDAVKGFADAGTRCVGVEGAYGPRALYLQGTAEFRRGNYASSAAAYRLLVDGYPEHSMADDALTRGGISLQEGGDLEAARAWWQEGLERFPGGDTVPEASWRLAFSYYLDGRPAEAIEVAERLAELPLSSNARHVQAGRYWASRWRIYPDVDAPTEVAEDPAAVQEGLDGWAVLIEELPWSYYSLMAHSRVRELDPERARSLAQRLDDHEVGDVRRPWRVRLRVFEDPAVQRGAALMRLGLAERARAEFALRQEDDLWPEEMAWWIELRIGVGDWLFAHDAFRDYLEHAPLGELGVREPQVIRLAWPDRYWEDVQAAVTSDRFDPRLFHALVREESNFNRTVVSFAGARGLSQLMPATARQTAGWLGMQLRQSDLDKPSVNLKIGARYFDAMHKGMGDSPYLALASYNAGAARVGSWLDAWGNVPTDEFVERIPYRETRGYVKRVMGTWQTMRWQFDVDLEGFEDLSAYNHTARPDLQ